jgi:hypothetical protein
MGVSQTPKIYIAHVMRLIYVYIYINDNGVFCNNCTVIVICLNVLEIVIPYKRAWVQNEIDWLGS